MSEIVSKIKYAMSLRTPQEEALSYLDAISSHCDYKKDSKDVIEAAASEYCEKQRKIKAGFEFPSFCYGHGYRKDSPDGSKYLLSVQDEGL